MANAFHSAGGGVGSTVLGAIVGSVETPYAAVQLGVTTTDLLTTGDLVFGDAGELGGQPQFAIEFWFQTASYPGSTQNLIIGPVTNSGVLRQYSINLTTTGAIAGFVTDDGAVQRGGTGSAIVQPWTWNHIVLATAGTNLVLYVNGAAVMTDSTWGTHSVRPLGTTVGSLDVRIVGPATTIAQYYDELAIYRTTLSAARIAAHYTAGAAMGFPFQKPGERINALLDSVASSAPRSLQLGTRNVIERYMTGQSPLEEIRRAVEAEDVDAAYFTTADGTQKFLADGHRSASPYTTPQVTVGDAGGAEIPYVDVQFDYSPTFLINEWNVTRTPKGAATPVTQTASDATSISRYFKRSQSLSDVPVTLDSDAAAIATALLAKHKDAMWRPTSVSFDLLDANVAEAFFRRDLMDRITIKYTPPGGGARIIQDVFIQKIDVQGDNSGQSMKGTWGVSPL